MEVAAFDFDGPAQLRKSLEGATTLFNTYWIRFEHKGMTFERAVENSRALIEAARDVGVRRLVHTSIANPSEDSHLPYYHGKAVVERILRESRLSYAILRPTVIFGGDDILINNIAWMLRYMPAFGVLGKGDYQLQPIHVDDFADLAVGAAEGSDNVVMDTAGPETFTFDELVRRIAAAVGSKAKVMHVPPSLGLHLSKLVGLMVHDKVLTGDEVEGLMAGLLVSGEPPRGRTRLSEWLEENAATVGKEYHSELKRHYRR